MRIRDRRVHVDDSAAGCAGTAGDITVVLDAGLGMSSLSWGWIRDAVSRAGVRVVSFDRPGLGRSPPLRGAPWLRRVDALVDQMHEVLAEVGATQRLVLVGHSSSGMHVRLYAHRHPDEVAGVVLVDAAHEEQLGQLEGRSVYNSYPPPEVTDAKLARLRRLWHSGLLRLMYHCSGPGFEQLAWNLPFLPLKALQRLLDRLGRAAAIEIRQSERLLAPHFRPDRQQAFRDEQLSLEGMASMLSEHGSQRASMLFLQEQRLLRPGALGDVPLAIVSRDPAVGAGGGLYPHARGDARREETHARFQEELARLSARGRRQVVPGAGHGSLLFVRSHAEQTAQHILEVVASARENRAPAKLLT